MNDHANARWTDPVTSHLAAATIDNLSGRQHAVWWVLNDLIAGGTDEQIAAAYQQAITRGEVERQSPSGLRTRRAELVELGLVRNTGRKERMASTGGLAIVWETCSG